MSKSPKPVEFPFGDIQIKLIPAKSGQWRRDFWLAGADGKKRAVAKYFGSWRDDPLATRAMQEYMARHDAILAGTDGLLAVDTPTGITVGELSKRFLEDFHKRVHQGKASLATFNDYLGELDKFIKFGGVAGAKVDGLRVEHFTAYAEKEIIGRRNLSPSAHRRVIACIRAMFSWGDTNGLCSTPPYGSAFQYPDTSAEAVRLWKNRNGVKDNSETIVTGKDIDAMLSIAQPLQKALILVAVNTGLGPADLGRLQWRYVDMENGWLTMPRGKTGRKRIVYLWKKTRKALRYVREELKHSAAAFAAQGQDAYVFVTRKNKPMYRESETIRNGLIVGVKIQNSITTTVGRIAKKAGLVGVTPYRLRHTFATCAADHSNNDRIVQVMMGHAKKSITDRYIHSRRLQKQIKRACIGVKRELWPLVDTDSNQQAA